jgi:hypothetical protein
VHPSFAPHAEAINQRNNERQQIKIKLATDPQGYLNELVEARVKAILASSQPAVPQAAEVQQLIQSVKQQQLAAEQSQINSWAEQQASKLYTPTGEKTAFHNLYATMWADLTKADPTFNERPLERHNEVVRRLEAAEKAFHPSALAALQQQPAQAQPLPAKKPSFMDAANARTNGHNRLSDYAGPARNAVQPQIPRGAGMVPSLAGIISGMTDVGGQ